MNSKIILIVVALLIASFLLGKWSGTPSRDIINNPENISTSTTSTTTPVKKITTTVAQKPSNTIYTEKKTNTISDSLLSTLIKNSTIRVPQTGIDAKFVNGELNFSDTTTSGNITLGPILGKVLTDNGYDVFVEMNLRVDGRIGTFKYVALFHNVGETVNYKSSRLIGDRIILNSITASPDKSVMQMKPQSFMNSFIGYWITVSYLDRKNAEPISAAPTLPKTIDIKVKNHYING